MNDLLLIAPVTEQNFPFETPSETITLSHKDEILLPVMDVSFNIGPIFFRGKAPFNTKVMIVTKFDGQFKTFLGFKKDWDKEYDFDEVLLSASEEEAINTHERTCNFFGRSSLFVKLSS